MYGMNLIRKKYQTFYSFILCDRIARIWEILDSIQKDITFVLNCLHISTAGRILSKCYLQIINMLLQYFLHTSGIIYKKLNEIDFLLKLPSFIPSNYQFYYFFFLSIVSNFNVINLFSRGFTRCPFYRA